ncbi:MAG TPA: TIGR01777 family oxidoreductase [Vicinamibacterales bacterium]
MNIVIAGGTGFLGRPLATALVAAGHDVIILTRATGRSGADNPHAIPGARSIAWSPDGTVGAWAAAVDGADVVINLAGEGIADRRWTDAHKRRVIDSRLKATRSLVAAIQGAATPPPAFISGSAVGYYGPSDDAIITESAPPGTDFLATVCTQWEQAALLAASDRTRVACIRTGIVLEKGGGALPQMLPPFYLGAGGPVGSGRQYWPWIHRADWVALVIWTLTASVSGAVNATAPNPVTSADFARALGRALHRPAFMPAPAFALRLLLGEMADALLLSGQRAVPAVAERGGFTFQYAQVDDALAAIFARGR